MKTQYGQGRKDVIDEMLNFCEKKISNLHPKGENGYKNATRTGLYRAFNEVRQELNVKMNNVIKKDNEKSTSKV